MRLMSVEPLGADNRRAAEQDKPQYDVGFAVAYSDEGEEVEDELVSASEEQAA
jgi:hypothetical protein